MKADQIDKGMVVILASGGPAMTVRAIYGEQAYCEWFSEVDRRLGTFDVHTLVPCPEADSTEPRMPGDHPA